MDIRLSKCPGLKKRVLIPNFGYDKKSNMDSEHIIVSVLVLDRVPVLLLLWYLMNPQRIRRLTQMIA